MFLRELPRDFLRNFTTSKYLAYLQVVNFNVAPTTPNYCSYSLLSSSECSRISK